ncbi:hypothetical protein HPB48_011603 [Haemaphysalis longicornis]|uniref:Uncharacterized protein n=1 Tax=Haemaphysalis longicornis TaxID=44386 RepID=A0A9J6FZ03_HAELO|nr:hypothetical protein HPB48_011603 [Haemaphysalis longicornis]
MYYPLGYFAPFTLMAELVFQDPWKKSHSCDEGLPDDEQARLNSWCAIFTELDELQVPQFVFSHSFDVEGSIEIQAFYDANPRAYAISLYIRKLGGSGLHDTRLVISKS